MTFEVPVFYLDNLGHRTSDRTNGQPCIEICISWDEEAGKGLIAHPRRFENVVGLIDTGAQGIVADAALINRCAMPWTREMGNRSSNGITTVRGHVCQLHFPDNNWTTRREVFGANLRSLGNPYDLLLGRVLLEDFEFSWRKGGLASVTVVTPTAPIVTSS